MIILKSSIFILIILYQLIFFLFFVKKFPELLRALWEIASKCLKKNKNKNVNEESSFTLEAINSEIDNRHWKGKKMCILHNSFEQGWKIVFHFLVRLCRVFQVDGSNGFESGFWFWLYYEVLCLMVESTCQKLVET